MEWGVKGWRGVVVLERKGEEERRVEVLRVSGREEQTEEIRRMRTQTADVSKL